MAKVTNTANRLSEYMRIFDKRQVDMVEDAQPTCIELGIKFNKSDLSQYLSGKVEPSNEKIYLMSKAFHLNPAWLMGYEVPMYDFSGKASDEYSHNAEKPVDKYDELDHIIADLLMKLSPQNQVLLSKLTPQNFDRLLGYAARLLEEQSDESSAKY